ncbi:MAG: DNA polymerase III subunit delta' [Actinobacteria bacterium]|nr:DNA polymerase III subunit delta' [Actinomycetota bacterium]
MIWDDIIGQTEVVAKLRNSIEHNVLSHAYLFIGPEGVGKKYTALNFACSVNCRKSDCADCSLCSRILNGIHPDVLVVEPEGNFITVGQIRDIQTKTGLKPFELKKRVYIIDNADKMNSVAANAFLRILEEPPESLIFILISSNLDNILPTVTSRCQLIRFRTISSQEIIRFLMDKYNIDEENALLVTKMAGGALSESLSFIKSSKKKEKRDKILDLILGIQKNNVTEIFNIADGIIEIEKDLVSKIKEKQKKELSELDSFVFSKSHASHIKKYFEQKHKRELNREEFNSISEILDIFLSWYRDIIVFNETKQIDLITNFDRIDNIREHSKRLDFSRAEKAFEIIMKTKEMIKFNVSSRLALETMLLKLQEV